MSPIEQRVSRRTALKSAVAGAGAVALVGCAPDHLLPGDVNAVRVGDVPDDDPDHRLWRRAPEMDVALGPQDIALPLQLNPAVSNVRVRALHDRRRVAFRLDWDDSDVDDLTIRVDDYRDACAVLIAPGTAVAQLRTMGSETVPATLLHWKADWQRDVDHGRQGLEAAYPNRSVDVYPPLWDVAPDDVDIATYVDHDATVWLPGMHVGNPSSMAGRASPIEKAIAYGFGTTTTGTSQNARGRGVRTDTGWRVVISKPLDAEDDGEIELRPGTRSTCAFAVWSGAAHDAGGRKAPSVQVYALAIED